MIIDFHPDQPSISTDGLKFIGYWKEGLSEITIPAIAMPAFELFVAELGLLPSPQHYIDEDWDATEKFKVVEYLKAGKLWEAWCGGSMCRFGDNDHNGTTDLTDGTYVWPEGFAHYVEVHNVKPPKEFIDHVLKGSTK